LFAAEKHRSVEMHLANTVSSVLFLWLRVKCFCSSPISPLLSTPLSNLSSPLSNLSSPLRSSPFYLSSSLLFSFLSLLSSPLQSCAKAYIYSKLSVFLHLFQESVISEA
jgi:hypothetical protein